MRYIVALLLLTVSSAIVFGEEPGAAVNNKDLSWSRDDGTATLKRGEEIVWQFNFGTKLSKPFFHPVNLPGLGTLTREAPADHRWHHGMWFCWKMINGVNYWEEHGKTGKSAGLTTWKDAKLTLNDDHSAHIEMDLVYNPPGKPIVLVEHRVIDVSAPDAKGGYQFDWTATFTAKADKVLLDRTPIPGEPGARSWGGYAGLSVRFAQNTKHFEITDSDGKVEKQADSLRFKARAVDFAGTIDKATGGIAILDHPQNLNAPTPWYVLRSMPYFSPAVLHDAPHKMSAGESFVLRYRVLVHPGRLTPEALRENQQKFIEVQN